MLLLMVVNLAVLLRLTFFRMARLHGRVQPPLLDAAAVFPMWVNLIPFLYLFPFDSRRDLRKSTAVKQGV